MFYSTYNYKSLDIVFFKELKTTDKLSKGSAFDRLEASDSTQVLGMLLGWVGWLEPSIILQVGTWFPKTDVCFSELKMFLIHLVMMMK